jgi:integrase/recombinase XerD
MEKGHVYNRIFSEEEWILVNSENKEIMIDFLEEYKQRKIKPTTLAQYQNDLRIILLYIKRFCENKLIFDLVKRDFRKLSIWLNDECGMSSARTNRVMSCCRSMLTYCEDNEEYSYNQNIAKKVKGLPKERVHNDDEDFFMTFGQIMNIRQKLLDMKELQLCVLHMLLFDSGARRNEIQQVKKYDLICKNKTNNVVGKRGKIFPLVYLEDTKELIKLWLEERGEDKIDSLFIIGKGDNKREASYENIYEMVMRIRKIFSDMEGRELNVFPHSWRHSRTECLLQGEDKRILDKDGLPRKFSLEQVQVFLHHENPATTQSYAKNHDEDAINEMFGF